MPTPDYIREVHTTIDTCAQKFINLPETPAPLNTGLTELRDEVAGLRSEITELRRALSPSMILTGQHVIDEYHGLIRGRHR